MMKKVIVFVLVICLLLAGCGKEKENSDAASKATENVSSEEQANAESQETVEEAESQEPSENVEQEAPAVLINPLPDTTMDNLNDAILSISLEEGDAYVDDTGVMRMDVKIYTYDKYDMVDIAMMKVGDTIVTHDGEVEITSLERSESGILYVNGGLEGGGFDLVTDDRGIFFETGYNDAKNWYEVGEETIRVSADFVGHDTSDLDKDEVLFYPGSFLVGEITDYHFTPYNTTIRVENGQIVEMHRVYIP